MFLPQEEYHFDKEFNIVSHITPESTSSQIFTKSNIIRPISLDGVPLFAHSTNDVSALWEKVELLYE